MYVIVNAMDTIEYTDLGFVMNEDGSVKVFESREEAVEEAKLLNGYFQIVELD